MACFARHNGMAALNGTQQRHMSLAAIWRKTSLAAQPYRGVYSMAVAALFFHRALHRGAYSSHLVIGIISRANILASG